MQKQFVKNSVQQTRNRIKNIDIRIPKIRAEFYVRLTSFLNFEPEVSFEGYEFYIKDTVSNKTFSAALTGFGPGYFAKENSEEMKLIIEQFHKQIFDTSLVLKNSKAVIKKNIVNTSLKKSRLLKIYDIDLLTIVVIAVIEVAGLFKV